MFYMPLEREELQLAANTYVYYMPLNIESVITVNDSFVYYMPLGRNELQLTVANYT